MFTKLYDALMADVDYAKLYDFLNTCHLKQHPVILDAGCGSGNFLVELLKHGEDAFGVDKDESMLAHAKQALSALDLYAPLYVHDLRKPLNVSVDIITSFFDVINYFKGVKTLFKNMYHALNDDGIYVFDCYKEDVLTTYDGYIESDTKPLPYRWEIQANNHRLHHLVSFNHQETKIIQYVHPIKDIIKQLEDIGFHVRYQEGPDIRKWYVLASKNEAK